MLGISTAPFIWQRDMETSSALLALGEGVHQWISPKKGSNAGFLFSLMLALTNSWTHRLRFETPWRSSDVTVMYAGLRPANERRRYFVTTSLIGWVQSWLIIDEIPKNKAISVDMEIHLAALISKWFPVLAKRWSFWSGPNKYQIANTLFM